MNKFTAIIAFSIAILCSVAGAVFEIEVAKLRAASDSVVWAFVALSVSIAATEILLGCTSGHFGVRYILKKPVLAIFMLSFTLVSVPYSVTMALISQKANAGNSVKQQSNIERMYRDLSSQADGLSASINECVRWGVPSKCDDDKALLAQVNQQKMQLMTGSKHTAAESFDEVAGQVGLDGDSFSSIVFGILAFLGAVIPFISSSVAAYFWRIGKVESLRDAPGSKNAPEWHQGTQGFTASRSKNDTSSGASKSKSGRGYSSDSEVMSAVREYQQSNPQKRVSQRFIQEACQEINGRKISNQRAADLAKKIKAGNDSVFSVTKRA